MSSHITQLLEMKIFFLNFQLISEMTNCNAMKHFNVKETVKQCSNFDLKRDLKVKVARKNETLNTNFQITSP